MSALFQLAKPVLYRMDPETAHNLSIKALKTGLMPECHGGRLATDPLTVSSLFGRDLYNPIGLAAGFDKNAEVIDPLFKLGFGFVEIGTVTPRPQAGNPRPRIFRNVKDQAVINRMGFPNAGMEVFKKRLGIFMDKRSDPAQLIGVNIGKNKNTQDPSIDYEVLVRELGQMADYLTINISSPNTPGLRDLQQGDALRTLLHRVQDAREQVCKHQLPPLFVKLAPDLTDEQLQESCEIVMNMNANGLILTNTTLARPDHLPEKFKKQQGGLSGKPLTNASTEIIRKAYQYTGGKTVIIGVGGISTGADAYAKIRAGASLVQVYTAMIFRGPDVARKINEEMAVLVERDGFANIREAIGADHKQGTQIPHAV